MAERADRLAARVWLTTNELAERLQVAPSTLRWWRHIGRGPKGTKLGGKALRYDLTDVEAWEAAQLAAQNPTTAA